MTGTCIPVVPGLTLEWANNLFTIHSTAESNIITHPGGRKTPCSTILRVPKMNIENVVLTEVPKLMMDSSELALRVVHNNCPRGILLSAIVSLKSIVSQRFSAV